MIAAQSRESRIAWLPWLGLLLLCAALQLAGAYPVLRLELPPAGYRWLYSALTCHLVHIDTNHWLADSFALLVIAILFRAEFTFRCWALVLLLGAGTVSAGMVLFPAGLHSYAGLSGVLHTLFVAGCLLAYANRPRLAILCLSLLLLKLLLEPVLLAQGFIRPGFPVAQTAHLFGALAGIPGWAICRRFSRHAPG